MASNLDGGVALALLVLPHACTREKGHTASLNPVLFPGRFRVCHPFCKMDEFQEEKNTLVSDSQIC